MGLNTMAADFKLSTECEALALSGDLERAQAVAFVDFELSRVEYWSFQRIRLEWLRGYLLRKG